MTTFTWSNGNGGDWSGVGNWSPDGVPGAGDVALIDLAGQYAISLDVPEIGSLTLNATGVTLTPSGTLKLDGSLDVKAGTLTVSHTIQGGTLVADGGTIAYAGGTLDGVTLSGPLDLSAANASLTIADGINFTGSTPGLILDTGAGSSLSFSETQTLDNVAIIAGNSTGTASLKAGELILDANSSLTVIRPDNTFSFAGLDNRGTVSIIDSSTFQLTNVTNTGTVNIEGSNLFERGLANAGTLALADGTSLYASVVGAFSNTGTITVDSTSTLHIENDLTLAQLGTIDNNGGTVLISGELDLTGDTLDITAGSPFNSGFRFVSGTVQGGTIKTDGSGVHYSGFTALSGVTIDGTLNVNGGANTELIIENASSFAGSAPAKIVETTAGSFLNFSSSRTLDDVGITLGNSSIDVAGTLTLGPASTLTLTANGTFGTPTGQDYTNNILDNKGTIIAAAGGLYTSGTDFGSGNIVQNDGLFAASGGTASNLYSVTNTGTFGISGAASVTVQILNNTGNVDISNGSSLTVMTQVGDHLTLGRFDSSGTVEISNHSTLTLEDGASQLGTISFLDGTGTVVLADLGFTQIEHGFRQAGNSGTLNLFQSGDVLNLGADPYDPVSPLPPPGPYSLQHSGNTLTVFTGSTAFDTFTLTGQDYTNATFTLTGDIVTTDAPCFCAGTLILTDQGERAVESLEVGDLVVTLQDGMKTLMPVRWLGQRRVVVAQHFEPEHVDPVRIMRDAVAPGMPVRDLFVSPDHALFLDGMLIQARQLVNHMTVTRDAGRMVVTYHHVELDRHAVLIADGMPCESYLDGGNRGHFDTAGTVVPLHAPTIDRMQHACAPLVTAANLVEPIWQRLAERARVAGHTGSVPVLDVDLMPWLETEDGVRLVASAGETLVFALPAGCLRVRLRSASDLPTTLAPWSDDRRRLGVAISALTLHQGRWRQDLASDTLDSNAGWWPAETVGDLTWRWTDGDGWIDLPEPAEAIEVSVHATMPVAARTARHPSVKAG